jgi:hypothetical protein
MERWRGGHDRIGRKDGGAGFQTRARERSKPGLRRRAGSAIMRSGIAVALMVAAGSTPVCRRPAKSRERLVRLGRFGASPSIHAHPTETVMDGSSHCEKKCEKNEIAGSGSSSARAGRYQLDDPLALDRTRYPLIFRTVSS